MSGCGCLSVGFADFWALRAENAGMGGIRKCAQSMRAATSQNVEIMLGVDGTTYLASIFSVFFLLLRAPVKLNKGHLASPTRVRIRVPRVGFPCCFLLNSNKFRSALCSPRTCTRTPAMVSVQEPRSYYHRELWMPVIKGLR